MDYYLYRELYIYSIKYEYLSTSTYLRLQPVQLL